MNQPLTKTELVRANDGPENSSIALLLAVQFEIKLKANTKHATAFFKIAVSGTSQGNCEFQLLALREGAYAKRSLKQTLKGMIEN